MLSMIRELFAHQEWADEVLLRAVRENDAAREDEKLRSMLHHIAMVQRGFFALFLGRPFGAEEEMRVPNTLVELERRFQESHEQLRVFVAGLDESELGTKIVHVPWFKGRGLPLAQALVQVAMHSQNHRGQCLARLRETGGQAPTLDFIMWAMETAQKTGEASAS